MGSSLVAYGEKIKFSLKLLYLIPSPAILTYLKTHTRFVFVCWRIMSFYVDRWRVIVFVMSAFTHKENTAKWKSQQLVRQKDTCTRHLSTKTEQARIIGFKRSFTLTPWARHGKKGQKTTIGKKKNHSTRHLYNFSRKKEMTIAPWAKIIYALEYK